MAIKKSLLHFVREPYIIVELKMANHYFLLAK
jgi:hypothetical protein